MADKQEITSDEVNLYRRYGASLERKIADLVAKLRQLDARVEIQRSILLKARQSRKVIDRLKDKRRERHQRAADQFYQAEMEELHLAHRGRKS
jgi:flagellar export protein FliJ